MSAKYTIKVVEDIAAEGVSPSEIEHLLDIAAYAVDRVSPSLARRAEFALSDFRTAKKRGISDFDLTICRVPRSDPEIWSAIFTHHKRRLSVQLSIVKES
ncbi:MAG TPA: hypothetical protein VKZ59_14000 [Acidobacteriota bacterium]|nr:hypothetical protein [Acidobacteriota bacterium]